MKAHYLRLKLPLKTPFLILPFLNFNLLNIFGTPSMVVWLDSYAWMPS